MSDKKEYELRLKVCNAYLLNAMRIQGIGTAAELSRLSGATQIAVGEVLNFKTTLYDSRGNIRQPVQKIADALRVLPEDLFPEQHRDEALKTNLFVAQASSEQMALLTNKWSGDPALLLEHMEGSSENPLEEIIGQLPTRMARVLRLRFGEGKTLNETAHELDVSIERIRQIEAKGLRFLRHPKRYKAIIDNAQEALENTGLLAEVTEVQEKHEQQEAERVAREARLGSYRGSSRDR